MAKKIPVRQCLGCNEHRPKNELVRVVKTPEGKIILDTTGKANGRGAYICKRAECFNKAVKSRRFENAFGTSVPEEIIEEIKKELSLFEQ